MVFMISPSSLMSQLYPVRPSSKHFSCGSITPICDMLMMLGRSVVKQECDMRITRDEVLLLEQA